jgi:hypothetical protein
LDAAGLDEAPGLGLNIGQARKAAAVNQVRVAVYREQIEQSLLEGFFFAASEGQNAFESGQPGYQNGSEARGGFTTNSGQAMSTK